MADVNGEFLRAKEQIKSRLDLVAIVSEVVPLKRSGSSHKGLCPFHQEKTPSFHVFADSQHFRCFGCSKGGDVFTWVMERESVSFMEALRMLAERAGVALPRGSVADVQAARERQDLYGILAEVQGYFVEMLQTSEGSEARGYVERRGLQPAIAPFGIGWAPGPGVEGGGTRWPLVEFFRRRRLPVEAGLQLGVVARSRQGHLYDRFRNRVMFPIHDERGRTVGFGGRILPGHESETEPKYLNSPESPVFNKRGVLFGLHQARRANARSLVVMEGYTDVIAVQLAGIPGAVATLGTSLTHDHAALLRRFAPDGVTLLFDGDSAGRAAAERAFHVLAGEVLPARICLLADGLDPADLVQTKGPQALRDVLAGAEEALQVFLRLLGQRFPLATQDGRGRAYEACCEVLSTIGNRFRRQDLLERMAGGLMLPPDQLAAGLKERTPRRRELPAVSPRKESMGDPAQRTREILLASILRQPEVMAELVEHWPGKEESFPDPFQRGLVDHLLECILEQGGYPARDELLRQWFSLASGDSAATGFVLRVEELSRTVAEPDRAVRDGVRFLGRQIDRQSVNRLKDAYRQALASGESATAKELELELTQALRRLGGPPPRSP